MLKRNAWRSRTLQGVLRKYVMVHRGLRLSGRPGVLYRKELSVSRWCFVHGSPKKQNQEYIRRWMDGEGFLLIDFKKLAHVIVEAARLGNWEKSWIWNVRPQVYWRNSLFFQERLGVFCFKAFIWLDESYPHYRPFPRAHTVKNLTAMQETQVWSLEREWQPTPLFLPGESHGQRSLAGYSL